jgi:hypothetical protein
MALWEAVGWDNSRTLVIGPGVSDSILVIYNLQPELYYLNPLTLRMTDFLALPGFYMALFLYIEPSEFFFEHRKGTWCTY